MLRLLSTALLLGAALAGAHPAAAHAGGSGVVTPAAHCSDKPGFGVKANENGFVDPGAAFTVGGVAYSGTKVTIRFLSLGGWELGRYRTPAAAADGTVTGGGTIGFFGAGVTVQPSADYVCKGTGEVKGWDFPIFTMQPDPPDPCRPGVICDEQATN